LSITVHQVVDPDGSATVSEILGKGFDQSSQFASLELLVVDFGTPAIIVMEDPAVGFHAVIAYGMGQLPDGNWVVDISDPNVPQVAMEGFYNSTSHSFTYYDGMAFVNFAVAPLHMMDSSYISNFKQYFQATGLRQHIFNRSDSPYSFVLSNTPVTIVSPFIIHRLPWIHIPMLEDNFSDNGGGDSQTFQDGIPGSVGIEEGSVQAYGIPINDSYTVDPSTTSQELIFWSSNSSSGPSQYGFSVATASPLQDVYNITPNKDGFNLSTSRSLTLMNLSFFYLGPGGNGSLFEAHNLSLPSGTTNRFTVNSWDLLSSPSSPSVTLQIYPNGSTSPSHSYHLVNGTVGLPSPAVTPALTWQIYSAVALIAAASAATVFVFVRRRRQGLSSRSGP
jgi:hypothetical protein